MNWHQKSVAERKGGGEAVRVLSWVLLFVFATTFPLLPGYFVSSVFPVAELCFKGALDPCILGVSQQLLLLLAAPLVVLCVTVPVMLIDCFLLSRAPRSMSYSLWRRLPMMLLLSIPIAIIGYIVVVYWFFSDSFFSLVSLSAGEPARPEMLYSDLFIGVMVVSAVMGVLLLVDVLLLKGSHESSGSE